MILLEPNYLSTLSSINHPLSPVYLFMAWYWKSLSLISNMHRRQSIPRCPDTPNFGERKGVGGREKERGKGGGHSLIFTWTDATANTTHLSEIWQSVKFINSSKDMIHVIRDNNHDLYNKIPSLKSPFKLPAQRLAIKITHTQQMYRRGITNSVIILHWSHSKDKICVKTKA